MSWAYDNGLNTPLRTAVRGAIVTLLQPLKRPIGFLDALIPIGFYIHGPTDDIGIEMLEDALKGRSPAIAVALCDGKDEPAGDLQRSLQTVDIELYFVTDHQRGLTEGRVVGDVSAAASDNADPGLDAMLELAWQLLFKADLGIGTAPKRRVQPLWRIGEGQIIAAKDKTIWHQHWATKLTCDVNLQRGITQRLIGMTATLLPDGQPSQVGLQISTDLIQSIAVTPATPTLAPNATQQLTAIATLVDGSTKDVTSTAAWSSSDLTIAQVDGQGLVVAVADGAATITVTSSSIAGTVVVTVSG